MYLIPQLVECRHVTPEVVGLNPTLVNSMFNPKIILKITRSDSLAVYIDKKKDTKIMRRMPD